MAIGTIVLVAGMSAPARAADDDRVPGGACREVYAFLRADAAILRAEGEIPARWKIRIDGDGKATAFITTLHCDITVDGRRRPVVYTTLSALLDSSALPAPERKRATSKIFGLPLDFYLFTWSSKDAGFARWLRAGTGLQDHVVQAPGLAYRMGAGALHDYAFTAPAPVPSPFSLTESVSDAVFGPATGVVNFWRKTAAGTVMIETTADAASLGMFDKLTLTAAPGSPLARILGNGGIQQRTCSAARLLSPLSGAVAGRAESGCFAYSAMQSAQWRKDIPSGGGPGEAAASRRCLSPRAPIGRRGIGRVRLGYSRERLGRIPVRIARRGRRYLRFCVRGRRGRVVAVLGSRGRAVLIYSTVPGHGNRGVRPGASVRRLRRAYSTSRRILGPVYRLHPDTLRLVGVRRGKVRFNAVAGRSLLRRRQALRRHLRIARRAR